ncbi:MAG: HMA2 domain-containing protein [Desulfobacca sp.]|uniref:HMA2 domain-containing protein n=1 Tax=Desulfobacca sp. TaxID=2067990 RepID=UPI00404A5417
MKISTDYLHALDGRIRIKVPVIKGSPARAGELEREVQWHPGIHSIRANPTTGNVLIYYDTQQTAQTAILQTLYELGYLQQTPAQGLMAATPSSDGNSLMNVVLHSVAQSMMEMALTRLVTALI